MPFWTRSPFSPVNKRIIPIQKVLHGTRTRRTPYEFSRLLSSMPGQAPQPASPLPYPDSVVSRDARWNNYKLKADLHKRRMSSDVVASNHHPEKISETNVESEHSLLIAARRIASHYNLNLTAVLDVARGQMSPIATWGEAAHLVGLEKGSNLEDAPSFILQPARVPDPIFDGIIDAVEKAISQSKDSGELRDHSGLDVLVADLICESVAAYFRGAMIKESHASMDGVFKTYGGLAAVSTHTVKEGASKLDAATNIISRCASLSHATNDLGFYCGHQIYNILLSDGLLKFSRFEDPEHDPPRFSLALFSVGENQCPNQELSLVDLQSSLGADLRLRLRPVCDAIFSTFLLSHFEALATCSRWVDVTFPRKDLKRGRNIFAFAATHAFCAWEDGRTASQAAADGRMDDASEFTDELFKRLRFCIRLATQAGELPVGPFS